MKRWAGVIIGVISGVIVTCASLYAIALRWPWLAGDRAMLTATAVAAVTESARPSEAPLTAETATPTSLSVTAEESQTRELIPSATSPAATSDALHTGGASWLPVTRPALQSPFEAQGFDFQRVQLGDNRDRWVAASPDGLALVEIVGAEMVEQASISVFGPIRQGEDGAARRAVYMLTMMNAVLPGWSEGAEWFSGELVNAARQVGNYSSEITHNGVRVEFLIDAVVGSITLSFEPDG